jgi:branched-chain amino acid transport system substrate-binding protein
MQQFRFFSKTGFVMFLAGLISVALLAAVPTAALAQQKTIKYGTMHPLTGAYAVLGLDQQRATQMAVEEWNAKGGVLGHKIIWVHRDDELKGNVAIRRAKELVEEEKCDFIGGTLSGSITLALNELACKTKTPYMAACMTDMVLGSDQCKYGAAFMVAPYSAALAVSQYAFKNVGKRWFSITADYRWGHSLLEGWLWQSQQMGGQFLGNVYVPLGTTDFSTYFAKVLAAKPDFIVMNNLGADQTAAIKQASELGLTKKIKIFCTKTAQSTIKELGPAYNENVIGGMTFYWKLGSKYKGAKTFVDKFVKKYGAPPEQDGECAYVAANLLFMAIEKAGTVTDKAKIMATLEGLKYQLTKGPEYVRGCDRQRVQSYVLVKGKGTKAKGWDLADIVAEIPGDSIIMSCDDNAKKLPFSKIQLPK